MIYTLFKIFKKWLKIVGVSRYDIRNRKYNIKNITKILTK